MITSKPFKAALLFSIGVHALLLSPLSGLFSRPPEKDDLNMEVTYIEIKEEKAPKEDAIEQKIPKISLKKEMPAPAKPKDEIKKEGSPALEEPIKETKDEKALPKVEIKKIFSEDKALDLNSISHLKGTSDSLNYLKDIRDKISRYVHRHYSAGMGKGEILLHFVLNFDGSVRSANIIRDTAGDSDALRELCLDSVYSSSPFRRFPGELDLDHAAFKIHISFKRN